MALKSLCVYRFLFPQIILAKLTKWLHTPKPVHSGYTTVILFILRLTYS
uniref:Uncharacterized protein n=1 Tax=Anguilla anguilla TaxID=7936 RepID=A0A0E9RFI3_ANGAN